MNDPGIIPPALDRRKLVHSFSSLNTYLNICPHQYAHRYIWKTLPSGPKPAAMAYGNDMHEAFEKRLAKGDPLPPEFASCEQFAAPIDSLKETCEVLIEQKAGLTVDCRPCGFFDKDVFLRGKIDVAVISKDEKTAYLPDWKSGKRWDKPFELEVNALYIKAQYPSLTKISGQYVWVKEVTLGKMFDVSDTESTWRVVKTAVSEIERDRQLGSFEKREGPLCGWCPVKSCEHNRSDK